MSVRAGSYGVNEAIVPIQAASMIYAFNAPFPPEAYINQAPGPGFYYVTTSAVERPAQTPLLADCIWWEIWWWSPTSSPPDDLSGKSAIPWSVLPKAQMPVVPRHGRRPASLPKRWPANQRLPGAVNVTFFDSHVELVPLDKLWHLYWCKDYQPPDKRSGLP